jgi:hypothetical protein
MRSLVALAALALLPSFASADESEASFMLEGGPAFLRVQELHDVGSPTTILGAGGAMALTYGLSDLVSLDLSVGGAMAKNAEYRDVMIDETTRGNVIQDALSLRAMTGITLRFGARWIPTLGVHVGYQRHMLSNAVLWRDPDVLLDGNLPNRSENDLLAAGSVGLEYRLDRHWLVGLSAQLTYGYGLGGNTLVALELPFRVTYSFYPGWFRSTRITRFED